MPSPGSGGSQSSLAGAVAWLASQFRRPKAPGKGAPIASYTMGTDPTGLGGKCACRLHAHVVADSLIS
jgi:hypothetical protein